MYLAYDLTNVYMHTQVHGSGPTRQSLITDVLLVVPHTSHNVVPNSLMAPP